MMRNDVSARVVRAFARLQLISSSFGLYISLREPNITEPLYLGDPAVSEALVGGALFVSAPKDNDCGVGTWLQPDVRIDASDGDDLSQQVLRQPHRWRLCFLPSIGDPSPVCSELEGKVNRFAAGCCSGFGETPRSVGLSLNVWLERHGSQGAQQHSRQRFNLSILPPRVSHRSETTEDGTFSVTVSPAQIAGIRRDGMNFQDYYRLARAHADSISGTRDDEADRLMDQMLSHLAEPRLCVAPAAAVDGRQRLARIVVLGDSHAGIFQSGHYHDYGSGGDNRSCVKSNYQTSLVGGATAHGLANLNSSTQAAAQFRESVLRAASLLLREEEEEMEKELSERRDFSSVNHYHHLVDFLVVSLGEVDVRSVARLRGVAVLEQIRESAGRLLVWVSDVLVKELGFRMDQVILLGAAQMCPGGPSPGGPSGGGSSGSGGSSRASSNSSSSSEGDKAAGGVSLDVSLAAARFNDELRRLCRGGGAGCLVADPSDQIVDYPTGQIHRYFWTRPRERHCSVRKYFFYHRAVKEAAGGRLGWCVGDVDRAAGGGEKPPAGPSPLLLGSEL